MAFYNQVMPVGLAQPRHGDLRRADDRPIVDRWFYNLRKFARRMKPTPKVLIEQRGVLRGEKFVEKIQPIEISNAFNALVDLAGPVANDEHIDIVLSEHPKTVREVIKKVPKVDLNRRLGGARALKENPAVAENVAAAAFVEQEVPMNDRFALENDLERIRPSKRIKREYRKAVDAVIHKDIYYYMKIKYFMKERTPGMVQQIINDARVYLTKKGSQLNTEEEYQMVSSLVLAIWLPSREELRFRSAMKNAVVLDGISAINRFNKGDLGTANRFTNPVPSVSRPSFWKKSVTISNPKQ